MDILSIIIEIYVYKSVSGVQYLYRKYNYPSTGLQGVLAQEEHGGPPGSQEVLRAAEPTEKGRQRPTSLQRAEGASTRAAAPGTPHRPDGEKDRQRALRTRLLSSGQEASDERRPRPPALIHRDASRQRHGGAPLLAQPQECCPGELSRLLGKISARAEAERKKAFPR